MTTTEGNRMPRRYEQSGGLTIGEACLQASSYLAEHSVEEPRANAELLLLHVLGLDKAALLRDWREPWPAGGGAGDDASSAWERLVERKAAGEPVQYLIGEQWFYGSPFTVTPAVLIPRPETELLVEAVLEAADRLWPEARAAAGRADAAVPTVVDVGTGSGAIAVTLAVQRPRWRVAASDLSADALEVARGNAARHGVLARMAFAQGDLLAPFARAEDAAAAAASEAGKAEAEAVKTMWGAGATAGLHIDVLVSNPPYIPASDIAGLQREVRDHEPRLALDGGADGLDPYRRMVEQLPSLAAIPRVVGFELGQGQAREVARLLREGGHWPDIRIVPDYAGIERHVIAIAP